MSVNSQPSFDFHQLWKELCNVVDAHKIRSSSLQVECHSQKGFLFIETDIINLRKSHDWGGFELFVPSRGGESVFGGKLRR